MDNFIKKMVDELYDADSAVAVHEIENTRFSANISVANLHMIDAVASRFKTTRADIVEDILSYATLSLFIALRQDDKDELAKSCDAQFDAYMKKIHKDNGGSYESAGLGYWSAYAHAFKEEAKKNADANG